MKVVIIDGQGGKLGQSIAEAIVKSDVDCEVYAIGTNSIATCTMLKGGAMYGATGENPVIVASRDADVIIGPVGIISADSMLGEVTPAMAAAVGQKRLVKLIAMLGDAFGLVLAMTGASALLLLVSVVSSLTVVTA